MTYNVFRGTLNPTVLLLVGKGVVHSELAIWRERSTTEGEVWGLWSNRESEAGQELRLCALLHTRVGAEGDGRIKWNGMPCTTCVPFHTTFYKVILCASEQVVHTHVPLSPSSIICYCPNNGAALCSWDGNRLCRLSLFGRAVFFVVLTFSLLDPSSRRVPKSWRRTVAVCVSGGLLSSSFLSCTTMSA